MFLLARILKGPSAIRELLIAQRGGIGATFSVRPQQYALLQPGETHILFLVDDTRRTAPDLLGLRRYLITGIWSGLFHFRDSRMAVETDGAAPDALRRKYEGFTDEQIVAEVKAALEP